MAAELKLIDPNRKAVLLLPAFALKVWMAYLMLESDDREAYPSMDVLVAHTGMDQKSIRNWRQFLEDTGWLVRLPGTAADRYTKPSKGAYTVGIYRTDDGSKAMPSLRKGSLGKGYLDKAYRQSTPEIGKPYRQSMGEILPSHGSTPEGENQALPSEHPKSLSLSVPVSSPLSVPHAYHYPVVHSLTGDGKNGETSNNNDNSKSNDPDSSGDELRSFVHKEESTILSVHTQESSVPCSASGPYGTPTPHTPPPPMPPVRMTDWGFAVCALCEKDPNVFLPPCFRKEYASAALHIRREHPEAQEQEVSVPCPHGCGFTAKHYLFAPETLKDAKAALERHLKGKCPLTPSDATYPPKNPIAGHASPTIH